jgi:hypothetical protein
MVGNVFHHLMNNAGTSTVPMFNGTISQASRAKPYEIDGEGKLEEGWYANTGEQEDQR